jgi:glutamyl-tRNA(Gln) amidotransferase subunit D
VSLLGTGGTIASYVDYKTGAVHPVSTSEGLAQAVPKIFSLSNISANIILQMQKLSENIGPDDWKIIAKSTAAELNHTSAGVIISHGTDTLSFTAAALSFMLHNLTGPVVLVGSQRSSDRPSSDAVRNLMAASRVALTDLGEVVVVMHGTSSPKYCTIHRETKVRKLHTSRRDAFQSVNAPVLGYENDVVEFSSPYCGARDGKTCVFPELNRYVAYVYYYPRMSPGEFSSQSERAEGVVIAGTGLGHVH